MNSSTPTDRATLITAVTAGASFQYLFFWGHRKTTDFGVSKTCFSQWYEAAFRINEELYRTAEHYMMVRKARLFGDESFAKAILAAASANEAKSLGRKVRGFSEQRWLDHREEIVFTGNVAKFDQNSGLKKFLMDSDDAILAEASPVDSIWGIGLAEENQSAKNPPLWPGLNLLGFTLMKVRGHLRGGS
jgi:ribA/ribD-fused uncharacterized protein